MEQPPDAFKAMLLREFFLEPRLLLELIGEVGRAEYERSSSA